MICSFRFVRDGSELSCSCVVVHAPLNVGDNYLGRKLHFTPGWTSPDSRAGQMPELEQSAYSSLVGKTRLGPAG